MSNANNGRNVKNALGNSSGSSNGTLKIVSGIIIFLLIVIALYYLYNFLYNSKAAKSSAVILPGNVSMIAPKSSGSGTPNPASVVQTTALTGVLDGGQYTVSFWVYVADTKGFNAPGGVGNVIAHLMEISDNNYPAAGKTAGNTLIFFGLDPTNGSLIVRQSSSDSEEAINNGMTSSQTPTGTKYPLSSLLTGYRPGDKFRQNDKCDILNGIEYQRWVLLTAIGNGRTLDIYIDGKLARSCVYKAPFALGSRDGTAQAYFGVNNNGNLKGYFSDGNFYNYALTPDAVWTIYQAGPGGEFSISRFFSNLFSTEISLGKTETMAAK